MMITFDYYVEYIVQVFQGMVWETEMRTRDSGEAFRTTLNSSETDERRRMVVALVDSNGKIEFQKELCQVGHCSMIERFGGIAQ